VAVATVKIASIIGVLPQLDAVINLCGSSQYFHPDEALSFYSDTHNFTPLYEENPYAPSLQALKDTAQAAGKSLDLVPVDKELTDEDIRSYLESFEDHMGSLLEKRASLVQALDEYQKAAVEISHFLGLKLDLKQIFACKYIKVRFGRIPKESYEKLNVYKDNPYVLFFQCTSDKTHYWGVYMAPIEYVSEVDRIFSSLYFERLKISATDSTPEDRYTVLQEDIARTQQEITDAAAEIDTYWEQEKARCQQAFTLLEQRDTYFGIRKYAAKYNNSFILTGWIPEENEADFKAQLEKIEGIEYSIERAEEASKHTPPVKLKNKKLFRPYEFFVDMFGLPNYGEVDPTPLVAITYTLLFGVMFGDVGQGLVVALVGYLMLRLKNMKLGRILIPCGISSVCFGLLYGTVFGLEHTLDPVYRWLFHLDEKPIEILEPTTTTMIIGVAVGIGIVMVMIAMLINIYSSLRRKNYENGIFGPSGIAGFVFYTALIFGALAQLVLKVPVMNVFYIVFLLVLPLLCIWFKEPLGKLAARDPDWKPQKWGEYIVQNFFELFEALLSYVTNTMSFLRVGAFVLVHAGMMLMVTSLAEMGAGFLPAYLLIMILGNALVIGLEGLLVGIQVLRLEFYEMFSRFFEGGGKPFVPIVVKKH
jgi:V/A-type H+-transporting ATPase subunit I